MKICLIGNNLTNLILANCLAKLDLDINIYNQNKTNFTKTNRTLAISNDNLKFLKSFFKNFNISYKISKKIKIYLDNNSSNQLLEFTNNSNQVFNLFKYKDIYSFLEKSCKKNKKISFFKFSNSRKKIEELNRNYNLIINSEINNIITKKYFYSKITKNYNSIAYTLNIKHKKLDNEEACQIFTKFGPLAFLPISDTETSIVLSYKGNKKLSIKDLKDFVNKYNNKYKIKSFTSYQFKPLKMKLLRNYYYKNFLCFGDVLHTIHPLAGQGLNMTIRDIKILLDIIKKKIVLGIELNSDVAENFEKKTKHLNFIYSYGVDFIYEFFNFDNKFGNLISKSTVINLTKNSLFKRYINYASDKGLYF